MEMFKYLVLTQWAVSLISDYAFVMFSGPIVLSIPVELVKIVIDNGTHSLTALICWTSVLVQLTPKDESTSGIYGRYKSFWALPALLRLMLMG